jgi:hypothetical protein
LIHENTCVSIEEHLCKAGHFKTAIRPDIWYWTETAVGKTAPITYLTLHLVEIKSPWGGIYPYNTNHETIHTADKVYWKAWHIYEEVRRTITSKFKPMHNGRTIQIKTHILCVWSLGAFDKKATLALSNILNTNTKRIISMWGKRIVVAAIKGSFNIWMKKNGWTNFVDRASIKIQKAIDS